MFLCQNEQNVLFDENWDMAFCFWTIFSYFPFFLKESDQFLNENIIFDLTAKKNVLRGTAEMTCVFYFAPCTYLKW